MKKTARRQKPAGGLKVSKKWKSHFFDTLKDLLIFLSGNSIKLCLKIVKMPTDGFFSPYFDDFPWNTPSISAFSRLLLT